MSVFSVLWGQWAAGAAVWYKQPAVLSLAEKKTYGGFNKEEAVHRNLNCKGRSLCRLTRILWENSAQNQTPGPVVRAGSLAAAAQRQGDLALALTFSSMQQWHTNHHVSSFLAHQLNWSFT